MHAQRADSEIPLQTFAAPFLGLRNCATLLILLQIPTFFPPKLTRTMERSIYDISVKTFQTPDFELT